MGPRALERHGGQCTRKCEVWCHHLFPRQEWGSAGGHQWEGRLGFPGRLTGIPETSIAANVSHSLRATRSHAGCLLLSNNKGHLWTTRREESLVIDWTLPYGWHHVSPFAHIISIWAYFYKPRRLVLLTLFFFFLRWESRSREAKWLVRSQAPGDGAKAGVPIDFLM